MKELQDRLEQIKLCHLLVTRIAKSGQVCWDSQEPSAPSVAFKHNLLHNPKESRSASRPPDIIFPNLFSSFPFKASLNFVMSQGSPVNPCAEAGSTPRLRATSQSSHIVTTAQRKVEQQLLIRWSFSPAFREYLKYLKVFLSHSLQSFLVISLIKPGEDIRLFL